MKINCVILTLVAALASTAFLNADEFSEKGRAIYEKQQHAVVTIQLVIKSKLSMSGRPSQSRESRQEVTGTIVDPSGLIVSSLSAIDPSNMVGDMVSQNDFKFESEIADLKILMQDGEEAPAEVVLRDKDLDLAFIRLKTKPASPLTALDLSQSGKAEVLDPVLALNRLGNAAGRSYSASAERISAIVRRPRLFYVPDSNMTTSSLGCPAFTLDGKVLGILVMRTTKSTGTTGGSLSTQSPNMTGIVIPAADVLKAASQVPAAGKETKE